MIVETIKIINVLEKLLNYIRGIKVNITNKDGKCCGLYLEEWIAIGVFLAVSTFIIYFFR